jgi:hypothetical protein
VSQLNTFKEKEKPSGKPDGGQAPERGTKRGINILAITFWLLNKNPLFRGFFVILILDKSFNLCYIVLF